MKRVLLTLCFASLCSAQSGVWNVSAAQQTAEGHIYHLRGSAEISNSDLVFRADQIDYDEDKAVIHLAGHVTIETKTRGTLHADEADYDVRSGEVALKAKLLPAR
jgi:lipopolysaccharide assembly outer membrane protein LptD (OstA)